MSNLSQYQLKCGIQNTILIIIHYNKMIKKNNSKFIKKYLNSSLKDYNRYRNLIEDKNWILKYAKI